MRPVEVLAQVSRRDVRVDLRGDGGRVTEMCLHIADIHARLDQVRTAGVAQRVGEHPGAVGPQSGPVGDIGHDLPDRGSAEAPATRAEEHRIGVAMARLVRAGAPVAGPQLRPADPQVLALAIEPPGPVKRMTRVVEVEAQVMARHRVLGMMTHVDPA